MNFLEPKQIAIAVVQCGDLFLVGQRPPGVPLAGLWEFPGGKIEAGETPALAAMRECREETGLAIEVVGRFQDAVHDYQHGRVQLHFLDCRLSPRVTAPPAPQPPFIWVARHELAQLPFPDGNRKLLQHLLAEGDSVRHDCRGGHH